MCEIVKKTIINKKFEPKLSKNNLSFFSEKNKMLTGCYWEVMKQEAASYCLLQAGTFSKVTFNVKFMGVCLFH